jgi:hypothetical protein
VNTFWILVFRFSIGKSKSKKVFYLALSALLFAICTSAHAQQPAGKIPRIGFLSRELHPADSRAAEAHRLEAFRQGLRELGYIEDKAIIIEYRYADARPERLPALAEELVRLKVEIIVAGYNLSCPCCQESYFDDSDRLLVR